MAHRIYLIVIGVLLIIILLLKMGRNDVHVTAPPVYIPGKPYPLPPETTIVEKPIYLKPEIPKPSSSDTLYRDTCIDLALNTYEVVVDDSVLSGKTTVEVEGNLKSVVLDYKAKQKEITQTILRVDTIRYPQHVKKNAVYLGLDLGVMQPSLAVSGTFVSKKGYNITSRYEFINRQATIGAGLKLGK